MKKNKLGTIIAVILITLIAVVVLADYLYSMRIPTYDEHGKIVAVTISGVGEEYHAYKEGDGYKFAYVNGNGYRQEFDLSKTDFNKLIRNDYSGFMEQEPYKSEWYTIFEFEDGSKAKYSGYDYRIHRFFHACERTFIYHEEIIYGV